MRGGKGSITAQAVFGAFVLVVAGFLAACGSSSTPTPASPELIAKGQAIYQGTVDGTSCQTCHGTDARGRSGVAPRIVGKSADSIKRALATVGQMRSLTLTDDEIEAVAAHLQFLRSQ